MSIAKTRRIHDDFEARLDEFLVLEHELDNVILPNSIKTRWFIERQSESILVLAFGEWEQVITQLFVQYLYPDVSTMGNTWQIRMTGSTTEEMAEAVLSGDRYFDFKSYQDLLKRADDLLARHPFNLLPTSARGELNKIHKIRNFILHKSRAAKNSVQKSIPDCVNVGVFLTNNIGGIRQVRKYVEIFRTASRVLRP